MATQAQVNQSARDSFINSAVGQYQSQLDSLSTGNDLLNSLITEYGMTRDEALAKMKMKSDERIAKYRTAASGGGGGSSSGGSSGGGFEMLSKEIDNGRRRLLRIIRCGRFSRVQSICNTIRSVRNN